MAGGFEKMLERIYAEKGQDGVRQAMGMFVDEDVAIEAAEEFCEKVGESNGNAEI